MGLVRFGISLDKELLAPFDRLCKEKAYANRSEAIRDLIRDKLVRKEWGSAGGVVTGVISIVYDHHKRELVDTLMSVQHDHQDMIIASQHIHMDHDNCLEVIIVKGAADKAVELSSRLRSAKGVKHGEFVMTTTGKRLR